MKKTSRILVTLCITLLFISNAISQETIFNLERNVNMFSPDSESKNISLNVSQNTSSLSIKIESEVQYGSLTIEIYNSKKEKLGEFTVESQIPIPDKIKKEYNLNKNYLGEYVTGQIQKYVNRPISGKWIIKIIPKEAIGNIKIYSQFNIND